MTGGGAPRASVPPRVGRWLLLVTAVAQLASPAVAGFDQGSTEDPAVVPPGPFFAVWGVVLLGCTAVAIGGLPDQQAGSARYRALHGPLTVAQVGFVVWLVAAAVAPVATVPVFAVMLLALALALRRSPRPEPSVPRAALAAPGLVEAVLGVYAGWAAAAVWINAATVLDAPAPPVLTGLLAGAVLTSLLLVTVVARTAAARLAAGAAGAWALCGVVVSAADAGADGLLRVAVAGLVAVAAATAFAAGRARRRTGAVGSG